jgi:small-conductance mechanosensitive channel
LRRSRRPAGGARASPCRVAWDLSHSIRAAALTDVFFAGPAQLTVRICFVVPLAIVISFAVHRVIRRITARAAQDSSGSERGRVLFRERRQQRASALGSVLENAASLAIFGIAAITVLGDMGLNLAPVLASAGVLGIAIGQPGRQRIAGLGPRSGLLPWPL